MKNQLLNPISFNELPGWGKKPFTLSKTSLLTSLQALSSPASIEIFGEKVDFRFLIEKLCSINELTAEFIITHLKPYEILQKGPNLFTGYYEPVLQTSHQCKGDFMVPIYEKPSDLFYIPNLGKFNKHLNGERLAGRLEKSELVSYSTRREIYQGYLEGKAKILAWTNSLIDFFFLQVQGYGVLEFSEGSRWPISYSATNGHAYKSVGKYLFERGSLEEKDCTMEGVKSYLNSLSSSALQETLSINDSYIFFEKRKTEAPLGTHKVELIPEGSLAVDSRYIPLGLPLWLDCEHPEGGRLQKVVLAHDTGSAIKGSIRGDYFWGRGDEAGKLAGKMKSSGQFYLLLPQ